MVAPVTRPSIRPSGWWYLAAVGVSVLGLVLGGMLVGRAFRDAQQAGFDASLGQAGGDQVLTILEPGSFTIAYSGPVVMSTTEERDDLIDRLDIEIRPAGGGDPLVLRAYESWQDLRQDDAQYVPLLTVRFDQPGDYTLTTREAGLDPRQSAIVVAQSPFRKLREGLERAVVVTAVAQALAVLGAVILARVRGRAKRAAAAATGPWGGPPGGQWPPGGGAPAGYGPPQQGPRPYPPPGYGAPGWPPR